MVSVEPFLGVSGESGCVAEHDDVALLSFFGLFVFVCLLFICLLVGVVGSLVYIALIAKPNYLFQVPFLKEVWKIRSGFLVNPPLPMFVWSVVLTKYSALRLL